MSVDPTRITVPEGVSLATAEALEALRTEVSTLTGDPTPPVTETPPAPKGKTFTEEDMAKARREEKDKLYSKLESMEEQLKAFTAEREAIRKQAEEAAAKEAAERKAREEAEMDARQLLSLKEDEWNQRVNQVQSEWEQRFNAMQQEAEAHKALLEKERQFQELQAYQDRRLAEEQENIAPELITFVQGNTPEEIEAAIERVKATSYAIMQSIQQSQSASVRPKAIPTTGGTPSGPMENSTEQQQLSLADIQAMSMDQWKQVRDRVLRSPRG